MRICPAPWAQRMVGMVAREEGQHLASRSSTAELGAVVSHAGNEESSATKIIPSANVVARGAASASIQTHSPVKRRPGMGPSRASRRSRMIIPRPKPMMGRTRSVFPRSWMKTRMTTTSSMTTTTTICQRVKMPEIRHIHPGRSSIKVRRHLPKRHQPPRLRYDRPCLGKAVRKPPNRVL